MLCGRGIDAKNGALVHDPPLGGFNDEPFPAHSHIRGDFTHGHSHQHRADQLEFRRRFDLQRDTGAKADLERATLPFEVACPQSMAGTQPARGDSRNVQDVELHAPLRPRESGQSEQHQGRSGRQRAPA